MLSDEEKKAIEYLKIEYEKLMKEDNILFPLYKSDAKRLIDIIEKQSKEIEELKKPKYLLNAKTGEITTINNSEFISKDKIKAKIEEFKTVRDTILENEKELNRPMMTYDLKRNDYCEKMLQSLLEKE